jgi:hypothetical protein
MEAKYYSIQKIQAGLTLLGYDVGKVDGSAGNDFTNPQIHKFLKDNKITGVDPSNLREVEKKVREKFLSDPKAQERLMEMSKNPGELNTEGVKVLKGAMALMDIRTGGSRRDRIVVNGVVDQQTKEAVAKLWKENSRDIAQPAAAAPPAAAKNVGLTDNRSVAERRADYYLDKVIPQYAGISHGNASPFPPKDKAPENYTKAEKIAAEKKQEIRDEIVRYESLSITEKDAQRAFGYRTENADLKSRVAEARKNKNLSEEDAVIKGAEGHAWALSGYNERPVMDHVEQDIRNFKFREAYGRPDRITELTDKPSWAPLQIQDYHYSRYAAVHSVKAGIAPSLWDRALSLLPVSAGVTPLPPSKNNWGADQLIDERQHPQARAELVDTILPDAAKATGVSVGYMRAVWGAESGFSRDIVSKSGCMGTWQFEKRTFAACMAKYGDEIAADLRARGLNNLADKVEHHSQEMKDLGNVWKAPGSKISNEEMQAMRFDPRISTLAAGYLNAENAESLKIDLNDRANWGTAYSAYNLGVQSTKTLRSEHWKDSPHVMGQIKAAVTNDTFFINPLTGLMDATGQQVLGNYEVKMLQKEREYSAKFSPSIRTQQPVSYASAQEPAAKSNLQSPFFRAATFEVTKDLSAPQPAIMQEYQANKNEMTQRVFAPQPASPLFTPGGPV